MGGVGVMSAYVVSLWAHTYVLVCPFKALFKLYILRVSTFLTLLFKGLF